MANHKFCHSRKNSKYHKKATVALKTSGIDSDGAFVQQAYQFRPLILELIGGLPNEEWVADLIPHLISPSILAEFNRLSTCKVLGPFIQLSHLSLVCDDPAASADISSAWRELLSDIIVRRGIKDATLQVEWGKDLEFWSLAQALHNICRLYLVGREIIKYLTASRPTPSLQSLPEIVNMSKMEINEDYPLPQRIPAMPLDEIPYDLDVLGSRIGLKFSCSKFAGMFWSRTALEETVWEAAARNLKLIRDKIRENRKARVYIGSSLDVWWDMNTVLVLAVPTLKEQSFFPVNSDDPSSVTNFMCLNAHTLLKDLDKVNDLVVVARNLMHKNTAAQVYAAESGYDQRVLQLLEISIRVCSRSMDCDPAGQQERTHAEIIQSYKLLMISCLQFLHNLIVGNESRKLALYIDLFGYPMDTPLGISSPKSEPLTKPTGPDSHIPFVLDVTVFNYKPDPEWDPNETFPQLKSIMRALRAVHLVSLRDEEEDKRLAADFSKRSEALLGDLDENTDRNSARKPQVLKFFKDILSPDDYKEKPTNDKIWVPLEQRLELHKRRKRVLVKDVPVPFPELDSPAGSQADVHAQGSRTVGEAMQNVTISPGENKGSSQQLAPQSQAPEAPAGERLGHEPQNITSNGTGDTEANEEDDEDDEDDEEDYEDDSEPEDDYDPYAASFKQHGILAEIPLILSPAEVEPLMMLLHLGVLPPKDATHESDEYPVEAQVFQALRCNLLVFSEQGRHLLRELLIYIAAWDLAEEDLYFKILLNIVKSILADGYMMLAYNGFREPKDVVSPPQQTLIKCLLNIFRKNKDLGPPHSPAKDCEEDAVPARLARDRACVYDMIVEFRTHVIPRTVAFIWLQGKIREQQAIPDDFPLNLWDVERIYEGVYQFIEFFAVLAETPTWKRILVNQDLAFELIELLRALDTSIPKVPFGAHHFVPRQPPASSDNITPGTAGGDAPSGPVPVAVERPYDTNVESPTTAAPASPPEHEVPEIMDAWKYEWRNLKKLVILCLSSLIWQTPKVKQQVRGLGGVELIMGCCTMDENNHFIKEHALLCLQFMVEETAEREALRNPVWLEEEEEQAGAT